MKNSKQLKVNELITFWQLDNEKFTSNSPCELCIIGAKLHPSDGSKIIS